MCARPTRVGGVVGYYLFEERFLMTSSSASHALTSAADVPVVDGGAVDVRNVSAHDRADEFRDPVEPAFEHVPVLDEQEHKALTTPVIAPVFLVVMGLGIMMGGLLYLKHVPLPVDDLRYLAVMMVFLLIMMAGGALMTSGIQGLVAKVRARGVVRSGQ